MGATYNRIPRCVRSYCYWLYISIISLLPITTTCCNRPGTNTTPPGFNDLTPMTGKRFVAYASPDPIVKPDTVTFACHHPGIDFSSIRIIATLDSGSIHIPLTNFLSIDGDRAVLRWVPGADTIHFSYFGIKTCILHLTDAVAGIEVESDSFSIIGPHPLVIQTPVGGARYSLNDTIALNYKVNNDRIGKIRVFFKNDSMDNWMEINGSTKLIPDNLPLKSFSTQFIPSEWTTLAPIYRGVPLRFFFKDYQSPLPNSSIISGDVFVE